MVKKPKPVEGRLPERTTLCGIGFRIQEHEGLIVFSEEGGFYGCHERIAFQRKAWCWYIETTTTFKSIMASHVVEAYKLVCDAYGGNHEEK